MREHRNLLDILDKELGKPFQNITLHHKLRYSLNAARQLLRFFLLGNFTKTKRFRIPSVTPMKTVLCLTKLDSGGQIGHFWGSAEQPV